VAYFGALAAAPPSSSSLSSAASSSLLLYSRFHRTVFLPTILALLIFSLSLSSVLFRISFDLFACSLNAFKLFADAPTFCAMIFSAIRSFSSAVVWMKHAMAG